jgi:dTDP-4-amino-4,6-dideoxygalactose transaminase
MEAGGATSAWIIAKLFPELKSTYMFSLGQVLNLCNYSKLENVNWFMVYRKEICETIDKINPNWSSCKEAYGMDYDLNDKDILFHKTIHTKGYNEKLYSMFKNRKNIIKNVNNETACSFIENKSIDYELYYQLLGISDIENHWANFGPVSFLLERSLKESMKVNQDKSVVVCKSATEALHALVGLFNIKAGKPLRWVVSAYGFFSSHIGPLTNVKVIDCDHHGMMDLEQLKALDNDSWDAVMGTNIFGLCRDISPYVDFCKDRNKLLVMDNAMAFLTDTRTHPDAPCEAVSFHHTKPWGIGEGGCAVINSYDEKLFRSLLNFGATSGDEVRPYSTNGKLSDFDSALILQRLINMPNWQRLYKLQARRINSIALKSGLSPLSQQFPENIIMGNLPFLAPGPVSKRALKNPWITMRKYYQPLRSGHNMANSIFSRIINIPCHPQVADVPDEKIEKVIDSIVNKIK